MTGSTNASNGPASGVMRVYRNQNAVVNTPPGMPSGLTSVVLGGNVTLSWNASADTQTASSGLTYNIYIGTSPGLVDMLSPMAEIYSGQRRLPARGPAQPGISQTIKGLLPGTYCWSVQAIDTAFAGSPFSKPVATFTIPPYTFSSSN